MQGQHPAPLLSPAAVKCNRHASAFEFRMDSDNLDILVFIWSVFHFRQMDQKQALFVLTCHLRCLTVKPKTQIKTASGVCVGEGAAAWWPGYSGYRLQAFVLVFTDLRGAGFHRLSLNIFTDPSMLSASRVILRTQSSKNIDYKANNVESE